MCGRYTLNGSATQLSDTFGATLAPDVPQMFARFNIAPSQIIPIVRLMATDRRELAMVRWGLVPAWADDPKIGNRMVNARADKVRTSGAYRSAFKYRRCLLPADGFYEWKAAVTGKQPLYYTMRDRCTFAFAGLWEHWQDAHGNELETATIITTDANELIAEVHGRMPVILEPDEYAG